MTSKWANYKYADIGVLLDHLDLARKAAGLSEAEFRRSKFVVTIFTGEDRVITDALEHERYYQHPLPASDICVSADIEEVGRPATVHISVRDSARICQTCATGLATADKPRCWPCTAVGR